MPVERDREARLFEEFVRRTVARAEAERRLPRILQQQVASEREPSEQLVEYAEHESDASVE